MYIKLIWDSDFFGIKIGKINNSNLNFKALKEILKNAKKYLKRRGLLIMVGRRRRLLDYLKAKDAERYENVIKKLNIRK
mgnify:CR=1 FL=1